MGLALAQELDERCTTKLNTMRSAHEGQLQKQKELLLTKEKQRREKWMHKEAKKIKDMTIKGLEPDIQRLVAQHKAEIEVSATRRWMSAFSCLDICLRGFSFACAVSVNNFLHVFGIILSVV